MDYEITKEINVDFTWQDKAYTVDIAPILNAIIAFVSKILEIYLPEDIQSAL